jgi:tetratricopeptide (TPR) repeat protein
MTALNPSSVSNPEPPDALDPTTGDFFEVVAESLERDALDHGREDAIVAEIRLRAARARADHARALFHEQRFADAAQALERALTRDPTRAELRYLRARLFERSGRIGAALAELDGLERAGHRSALAALLRAACHETAGEREPAVRALARAAALVAAHPAGIADETSPWRLWRDPVLDEETARVRTALEHRIAAVPDAIDARLAMAELVLDLGRLDEAAPHLDVVRSIGTGGARAMLLEGRSRLAHGGAAEAAQMFDQTITCHGEFADLKWWAGIAHERAGHLTAARQSFERSLARNRCFARAWQALALLLVRMNDTHEAARVARQATVRHRERAPFSGPVLAAAVAAGDPNVASIAVRHAALHPGYPDLARVALHARRWTVTRERTWVPSASQLEWASV